MADSPSELQFEIETLERRHAENPEGRFFVPLANAYRKLGDVETAEALLRSGIERHPDYLSAHIVLGRCLADRGAARDAEGEFRFVLSQDPQNLIALRTLGELAAADGRPAEAAEWYNELLAVDPMNEEARQALETLGGAPAAEELDAEFRSGTGWWEAGGGEEAAEVREEPIPAESPPEPDAEDPARYGDVSLDDQPAGELDGAEEFAQAGEAPRPEPSVSESDVRWSGNREEHLSTPGYGESASSEVVTETIAELYARQGLHERAAAVYRELIRRRGGDPALESRLAEIESMAGDELADEEEERPGLSFEDEEALVSPPLDAEEDAFADSFTDGFTTVYDDEPSAEPEEEEPVVAAGWSAVEGDVGQETAPAVRKGTTIVDFLSTLASWHAATVPAHEIATPAPEPAAEEPWEGITEDATQAEVEDLPYLQQVGDIPESAGTGSAEDEPFPWELPGGELPGREAESEPREPEPSALDPYFVDDVEPAAPAEEPVLPEAAPPPAQSRSEPEPSAESDPSEDEDLESFQAWLRSLKR